MGYYKEIFNSDDLYYGGSDLRNLNELETSPIPYNRQTHSVSLKLPPLAVIVLKFSHTYGWFKPQTKKETGTL